MMVRELLMSLLLIKTVQPISAKIYYVLFTKILQRGYKASGTVKTEIVNLRLSASNN